MIPDFDEKMVEGFEIFKRTIKHENGLLKTKLFKNQKVSQWEISIYETIRSYTKYYDYVLIKNLLNDNEIKTFSGVVGGWHWESVRDVVRRVEDYLGITSRERYCLSLRSHDYKLMMKRLALQIKDQDPEITQSEIARQFNIHKYPYQTPDAIGTWTPRRVSHILKTLPKKNKCE